MAGRVWQTVIPALENSLAWASHLRPTAWMQFDRRHFLASPLALSTGACASTKSAWPATSVAPQLPVIPLQISETRLDSITVCTRPFRPGGPRIDVEKLDEKTVVHNYGHGGSGWSLSWACADEAAKLVKDTEASEVAVIGAAGAVR